MINNILMSLYSILPNEEKNEFYYFKQADNYLSALLPYKLTDITNVDNFLITTGTINIKYDILNINQLMNTSYVSLTYTSENDLKTYQFYKVLTKEIRKEYCVFSVEKDLWANGLCQNAMFDYCNVLRCNRNIGTGVFDNVNNLKSVTPLLIELDTQAEKPLTDLVVIFKAVQKINNSTLFTTNVSTSTDLYLYEFTSNDFSIKAVLEKIAGIYKAKKSGSTQEIELNLLECWLIEKKYINFTSFGENWYNFYSKTLTGAEVTFYTSPIDNGIKDTYIALNNLGINYKNFVGTKNQKIEIKNKNTIQEITIKTITQNDDFKIVLIYENNEIDLTNQFAISLTTNDANLTSLQQTQQNLKQIANIIGGVFQVQSGGVGLISGTASISQNLLQNASPNASISQTVKGDGLVTFENEEINTYNKPFYITAFYSLFDETENAKKKGINFNSFIDFDSIFTKDYIVENTDKTFIQAVVNLPNIDIENKTYIESLLQNGIYIKAV